MGFTYAEGVTGFTNGGTSAAAVLTGPITTGDLICIGINTNNGGASGVVTSVVDNNGNAYTKSTSSPAQAASGIIAGSQFYMYYLVAPSNAGTTITVTVTVATDFAFNVDRFSVSGGTATFDKDAIANTGSGATINTPSITPTNTGSLIYAGASVQNTISHPLAGATLGVWTGGGAGQNNEGSVTEYLLSSASGATLPNMTMGTGAWISGAMTFFIPGTPPPTVTPSLMMMGMGQ